MRFGHNAWKFVFAEASFICKLAFDDWQECLPYLPFPRAVHRALFRALIPNVLIEDPFKWTSISLSTLRASSFPSNCACGNNWSCGRRCSSFLSLAQSYESFRSSLVSKILVLPVLCKSQILAGYIERFGQDQRSASQPWRIDRSRGPAPGRF